MVLNFSQNMWMITNFNVFPLKAALNPKLCKGLSNLDCVFSPQLNDPLQKVIILTHSHKLPSEQLQPRKTRRKISSLKRGAHGLFVHQQQQ